MSNREDFKKKKLLEEARKTGRAPAEVDEEGRAINPHIPEYISKAPWYLNTEHPTLKHQRAPEKEERAPSDVHQIKGFISTDSVTKYRKGACENCGSLTHKLKDCVERPRKKGAKWTGQDIKPDEFIIEGAKDFDGKRDRWAGFNPEEYDRVVDGFERVEEERRKLKEKEVDEKLKRKAAGEEVSGEEGEEGKDVASDEDEEKYAEATDMPGQKVDTKARMTVRNLRIREDTAKYLRNLNPDSAYYDPKTRSMRDMPNPEADPEKETYFGDNFMRGSGDAKRVVDMQVFAWQAFERGEDLSAQANPSQAERLYKQHLQQQQEQKRKLEASLEAKYGPQDDVVEDDGTFCDESDVYVEYSKNGKVLRATHQY